MRFTAKTQCVDEDDILSFGSDNPSNHGNAALNSPVKEKIRKLMETATHPTTPKPEADNAARLAQNLLRKHSISSSDIFRKAQVSGERELASAGCLVVVRLTPVHVNAFRTLALPFPVAFMDLSYVIARMFHVSSMFVSRSKYVDVTFYGVRVQAALAALEFEALLNRCIQYAFDEYRASEQRNDFLLGFTKGVRERVDQALRQAHLDQQEEAFLKQVPQTREDVLRLLRAVNESGSAKDSEDSHAAEDSNAEAKLHRARLALGSLLAMQMTRELAQSTSAYANLRAFCQRPGVHESAKSGAEAVLDAWKKRLNELEQEAEILRLLSEAVQAQAIQDEAKAVKNLTWLARRSVTKAFLSASGAGKTLNKLTKSAAAPVAEAAKEVIEAWKAHLRMTMEAESRQEGSIHMTLNPMTTSNEIVLFNARSREVSQAVLKAHGIKCLAANKKRKRVSSSSEAFHDGVEKGREQRLERKRLKS